MFELIIEVNYTNFIEKVTSIKDMLTERKKTLDMNSLFHENVEIS